ncbi:MAG: PKD-like domain-containing protein, partial [Bacteroidota bacterium]
MGVIHNPGIQGTGCNFQRNAVFLNGNICFYGLPQFLQKYKTYLHYKGDCQWDSIRFSGDIWPPADSIHWNFGDPASGAANYSNDTTPSHIYALPGQYTVELFVRHIDNRTDTSWVTITIYETPAPELGSDTTICQGDSVTFDAGFCPGCTYEWASIPPGFSSNEQIVTLDQTGVYTVAVTSPNGCTGRDTVQLTVTVPPAVTNSPLSKSICSGESTNILLTATVPNTAFSWTAVGSSPFVTGFSPGTGDTIDQTLLNAGPGDETVTYTITPAVGGCIGDSVQYIVTVIPGDSVSVLITASADSVCEGTPVTFTAIPTNGGASPTFQWMVNGIPQGTNDPVFIYTPANNDSITCLLTSSNTICSTNNPATSDTIIITVFPILSVGISITPSGNPVCEGMPVTFTATSTNGGSFPTYQWQVNATNAGMNNAVFTYTPINGDTVTCILTSSEPCTSSNQASSNPVIMTVVEA